MPPIGPTAETREEFAMRKNGDLWLLPIAAIDPTGADDNFAYLKNDGLPQIEVLSVDVLTTVAGIVKMEKCSGTAAGVTARDPLNLNGKFGDTPEITFGTGVDITGLTDLGIVDLQGLAADLTPPTRYRRHSIITLNQGDAVLLNWDTATGILTGGIRIMRTPDKD